MDQTSKGQLSIGDKLMLVGHILNGIAVALLSVGSILREGEEIPTRLRNLDRGSGKIDAFVD